MELLRIAEGLDMVHVPYKGGAGPAVAGLMGGETHVMFTTAASAIGQVRGGKLKLLAVTSPRDRKSTRLNSSHSQISYAVFCLKKKKASYTRRRLFLPSAYMVASYVAAIISAGTDPPPSSGQPDVARDLLVRSPLTRISDLPA